MAILVLFEQFSGKLCLNILPLILTASRSVMQIGSKLQKKLYLSVPKTFLKSAGWGVHVSHPPLLSVDY